jgi:hypothetical protein
MENVNTYGKIEGEIAKPVEDIARRLSKRFSLRIFRQYNHL